MTEQHHPQPSTAAGVDSGSTTIEDLKDLDAERAELVEAWAEFSRVRASVGEVLSDDEPRAASVSTIRK